MKQTIYSLSLIVLVTLLNGCGSDNSGPPSAEPVAEIHQNQPPVIEAPDDIVVDEDSTSTIATNVSDSDGNVVSINWVQLSGPDVEVQNANAGTITLITPEVDREGASVELSITATDNDNDSTQVIVQIEIRNVNAPPIAIAGDNQGARVGNGVILNGAESYDPDGTITAYQWRLVSPSGSSSQLTNPNDVITNLLPDMAGIYVAELTVFDNYQARSIDQVEILVEATDMVPIAIAGDDQEVATGTQVLLNGTESYDPEGARLSFTWSLVKPENSTTTLVEPTSGEPSFFADVDGQYQLTLIVNDGQLDSVADTTIINASTQNAPPVSDAGPNQAGSRAIEVLLDGSASYDPNGDPLAYQWSVINQPNSSSIMLIDDNAMAASFVPHEFGNYVINLTVNDGELSDSSTIVITVTEGDIYIDLVDQENVRFGWPYDGFFNIGTQVNDDSFYDLESLALIATGSNFKIKFSAIDRNGVTEPYCGDLSDGQIILAGEPVYFSCGINVVKGAAFDVEYRIEIEGYPEKVWTYVFVGTFN